MKYNQNANTFLFLQLFTTGKRWKNIEKTLFVSAEALKRWKTAVFGSSLPRYLQNPKSKFPVKFIFTQSIFALLSTIEKAKTISLKIFKIKDFKRHTESTEAIKGTMKL